MAADSNGGGDRRGDTFWKSNALCILTGASKGLGKALAVGLAQSFADQHQTAATGATSKARLSFVLLARDHAALDRLCSALKASGSHIGVVVLLPGSLDDDKTLREFETVLHGLREEPFDQVLLIHNAGSLGNPKQLASQFCTADCDRLTAYFKLNVSSVVLLTGTFLAKFEAVKERAIINISSLAAVSAMKGLNIYCTGKRRTFAYVKMTH